VSNPVVIDAEIIEEAPALPAPAPKKGKRMLILAAVGGVVLLAGLGGGAYAFLGAGSAHGEAPKAASSESAPATYVDVPQMIVNLHSPDGRSRFLKLHFMLVPGDNGKAETIKAKLPVFLDALQPFLREIRPEDLNGSAAVFRMKEEMLNRANDSLGTGTVRDILIQDLIQQ
jgi:flagellar protein FliL